MAVKRSCVPLLISALLIPALSWAESRATVPLSAPSGLAQKVCPAPAWNYGTVVWKGVVDARSSPEIGLQTQKGKDPIPVYSEPAAAAAFDGALRELLPACGMMLSDSGEPDSLVVTAELREFYTGVEKKLFTGKSTSRSAITFKALQGNRSSSVTVGYEMEAKKVRSGNIKQLQRSANELFIETLKQIPETPEMAELK